MKYLILLFLENEFLIFRDVTQKEKTRYANYRIRETC